MYYGLPRFSWLGLLKQSPPSEPWPNEKQAPASRTVCGARVDGKLLLLWVVAHGEGQLLVHGFDPQTSQRMTELVIGPEDWASTGYGALLELAPAEVQALCGKVCGMLKLDEAGTALPFTAENLAAVLDVPYLREAIESGLYAASRGAVAKN